VRCAQTCAPPGYKRSMLLKGTVEEIARVRQAAHSADLSTGENATAHIPRRWPLNVATGARSLPFHSCGEDSE